MKRALPDEVGFADEVSPAFGFHAKRFSSHPFEMRGKFGRRTLLRPLGLHGARVTCALNVPSASIPVHR